MPFRKAESWKERGLQIQAIKDKCNSILKRLGLPDDDARAQGMIHVRQCCNTIAAIPIKLQQNAEIPNNIPLILSLLGLSDPDSLKTMLTDLNQNAKFAFLTVVQFSLENCIVQIINAIGQARASGKFSQDAKLLIKLCAIPDPARKLEIVMVPAWLRNTLHANGIHRWSSKTVILDGEAFVFEQNQRIKCGSWSHIAHAILHSLNVYEELLTSNGVTAIQQITAR